MRDARLDEAQAGIKTPRRNSNNPDMQVTPPIWQKAKKNERALLMEVKEESEKAGLKLNFQKTNIMASAPITSRQIDREKMETVTDFIFSVFKITVDGNCNHKLKDPSPWKKS